MPIKKAAFKALRQDKKRRLRNLRIIRGVLSAIKKSRKAIEKKSQDAESIVKAALKTLDKAAQKGVIKELNATRRKSRLMHAFNKAFQKK